ncbi:MAG: septum formation initiator family protein [Candidatus Limiplasma sp.]|nr:septum formation initiator family protein [Candidatus Limiplasma sp.]
MRRSIRIWPVLAILACMLVAFLWSSSQVTGAINQLEDKYSQSRVKLTQLENEQVGLKETLDLVGTEAFIENRARTMYGYMKPDEIRFVITNPEVLYGSENVPEE